jgi:hypothetical protein
MQRPAPSDGHGARPSPPVPRNARWRLVRGIATIAAIAATVSVLLGVPRPRITRAELGIAPDEIGGRCVTEPLKVYQAPDAERPVTANEYLPFVIASLNAYDMGEPMGFTLARHSPEWQRLRTVERPTGLRFDVYHRRQPGLLSVMVAYSGSEAHDLGDWHANLSWFTAWLPVRNQYDDARDAFHDIRAEAYAAAGTDKVAFYATGHSLGGGIAQHIAYAFPCVSAPIFNASFVVLKYRLAAPFTGVPIVHIYEDLEPITRLRRLLFVDRETAFYRHFRVTAVDMRSFTHSITGLAVGIARNVVHCQARVDCMVPAEDTRAVAVYCPTFGVTDPSCPPPAAKAATAR